MKKILHIIAQYPSKTGSGIFLESLVREANKKGYKQYIIGAVSSKMERPNFNYKDVEFNGVEFNSDKLDFNIVGMSDVMPYDSERYSDLNEEKEIKWKRAFKDAIYMAINEFKPDIILTQHLWLTTSIAAKLNVNARIIGFSQGSDIRQISLSPRFKEEVKDGCLNLDLVCALNEYQKREIINNYGINEEKIKVMGIGYNSNVFNNKNNKERVNKIIYAGKLSFSKGVKSLINAFNIINDSESELIIVGSGSGYEEEEIKAMAKKNPNIKFLGSVSQIELSKVFNEGKVFVLPSFYEGLPLVIVEALSCGLNVVSSNINGVQEWIGDIINNSGKIEYIDLPRMKMIDVPLEEDLKEYEINIASAIKRQLKSKENYNIENELLDLSWERYFDKLEKYF